MIKFSNRELIIPYIILFLVMFLSIYPLLYMISTSLMTSGEAANQYMFPKKLMFENYAEVWKSNNFQKYTINSIIISFVVVTGVLFTSIPAAYAFAKIEFPFRDIIFYGLLISLMIPEIIALLPHLLIIRGDIFPLPFGPSWMNSLQGLTVPFFGNVFLIFLLRQYFKKIPNELWDAARMDGATHFFFLRKVVVPMSMPIIVTVALFAFILAWNSFAWPLLILTRDDWFPVTVSIYSFIREVGANYNLLMAASLISIAPVLLLYFFTQRLFLESISNFGLKQ
ncbi:MAG: L-arabinose transport system permease protein AraQ [Alphaproteobacteria bacterium MarineAlpha5_Bin5]|nr:MAG: L-arabinose transport system permease protein AraQ [Alphaproteobacteria bacterium MarineAlpha5_Bin5]PPR51246.1 MAG: L-arabinose transport system permease protein AraQ [Alphaproteobacteria bacterium MarineAlpha5_Bin4]|tara:strand:+ start:1944 stop:2789 length:846 start_codon:yes stop_codon:yes gene_type:complete